MSDTQNTSAILEDLEDLFSWNPPPFRLATVAMGGSISTSTREPSWYDKHLAPNRICKKIVHVKDLHRKIAAIVDEKLQTIHNRGIVLAPPTSRGYTDKEDRRLKITSTGNPAQNELSIQAYYHNVTSQFCVYVASTLALHPHIWRSVIEWYPVPIAQGDAVSDGSLKLLFSLNNLKRDRDQTIKNSGPHYVDADLWQELMEVSNKYGDMAIWEMKSVSVGDGRLMLGIMALATGKEQFEWLVCKGGEDHTSKRKGHHAPPTQQLEDDPETMSKFGLDDLILNSNANSDLSVNVILDEALRRGGSSLEHVEEFDRKLMQEAKGVFQEDTKRQDVIKVPSPKGAGFGLGPLNPVLQTALQGDPPSARALGFWNSARSAFRKRSQDEKESSLNMADSSLRSPKSALRKPSQGLTAVSKKGKLNISIPPPFNFRRKTSQKRSPSKSPQKTAHDRTKGKKAGKKAEKAVGEDEGEDDNGSLTAQSVLQQVWSQGVHSQATILIVHSGNYEYVCFRHRATQTLYVSDVLHVPFLRDPGYAKLQIGIYIAAMEDALGRHRLEKRLANKASPPDDGNSPDPGGKDHDNSDDSDDDDDNEGDDQHKPKRRRKRDQDARGAAGPSTLDWAMWQARSRHGLAIHLTYGIYDSIYPALFDRVGNRGTSRLELHGVLTPPTSPLNSPANSPPLFPPTLSSPTAQKRELLALFLTSEIGLRTSGILHGGIAEVDVGQQTASLNVTAKLAFVENHQNKLFHELSVYNHLASKGVKGIPPVLGIFHNAIDEGPYCLVLRNAGLSIHDSNARISNSQSHQFSEMLMSIHKAGIVHGNLRLDNLLVDDSGDVAIVDFDHARLSYDAKEHDKEHESLVEMLKVVLEGSAVHLVV